MYIKFCSSYGEDKKDEASANLSPKAGLSVALEGEKDKETNGKTRLYRAGCLLLGIICLILLLIIIVLCVKLQNGSTVCPVREETAGGDSRTYSLAPDCSFEQCQAHFPNGQPKYRSCQQCANGWLTFGQSCFFLSTFRMSWEQSQTNCTARGGSLAVISNAEEQRFLTKEGKMKYWIGLRKKRDTWMWVNNTRLQESFWKEVTPDQNCGILESASPPEKNWITGACYAHTYFICQLKL